MLSDEERKVIEELKNKKADYFMKSNLTGKTLLNLIEKQQKEIEELKREKETNQQMIHLAETQILGYGQGYKDGLNKETTATEIVARERENQIIYEGIKHKINMQWVLEIKAKIEELEKELKEYEKMEDYAMKYDSVFQIETEINILLSLLEKE